MTSPRHKDEEGPTPPPTGDLLDQVRAIIAAKDSRIAHLENALISGAEENEMLMIRFKDVVNERDDALERVEGLVNLLDMKMSDFCANCEFVRIMSGDGTGYCQVHGTITPPDHEEKGDDL